MSTVMYGKIQKKTFALLIGILLCVNCFFSAHATSVNSVQVRSAQLAADTITKNGMVRVYLASLGNPTVLDLTVNGNYSLSHNGEFVANGSQLRVEFSSATGQLSLTYRGQKMQMGKSFSLRRHSTSGANGILIAQSRDSQNPYPGDLSFEAVLSGGVYTLYTIAHIYIENYLYGVLPYEMGNSSGLEALKAQAVAARTYTVRMMVNRASGRYDVKDTTSDQVYRGTPTGNTNCVSAVDATKGIVLMDGSNYITTYYSASNGGQTETLRTGSSYVYMKVKDDPFDYANPASTVKTKTLYSDLNNRSNPSELLALLKNKAIASLQRSGYLANEYNTELRTLKGVTPHTPMYPSPSRVYTKMDFTFTVSTYNSAGLPSLVTLTETCGIFSELEPMLNLGIQSAQNELWTVEKGTEKFVLSARRYGHGMGMSQRGAMYMAKLGYTYDKILGFYFEGCKRVKHSFTNRILNATSSDQEITVESPAELEQFDSNGWMGTVKLVGNHASVPIRYAASSTSSIIGTIGNGALVQVLHQEGNWYQIRFGELVGYIPSSSLEVRGTPVQQPSVSSTVLGFATVTASDFVNLRAGSSTNASILGTAPAGSILSVFSKSGSWAKVQYQALSAYVNINYISQITKDYPSSNLSSGTRNAVVITEDGTGTVNLRKTASTAGQLLDRLAIGTQITVLEDDGTWCRITCTAGEGYILSSFVRYVTEEDSTLEDELGGNEEMPDDENETSITTAIVNTQEGSLNLRSKATLGSNVLTTIPKGTIVNVVAVGDNWSAVRYAGYDGYVMTQYLLMKNTAEEKPSDKPEEESKQENSRADVAVVATHSGALNMRLQPSLSSSILTTIPQFAAVSISAYGNGWCAVKYNGYEGYVMTRYLSFDMQHNPPSSKEETQLPNSDSGKVMWVQTQTGDLNLRTEPNVTAQVITTIPNHAQVTLSAWGAEWSAVTYQGNTGYVMSYFLTEKKTVQENQNGSMSGNPGTSQRPTVPDHEPSEQFITIGGVILDITLDTPERTMVCYVDTETPVYSMCSENESVLFEIPFGEEVDVVLYGKQWCRVEYQGKQGYCLTKQLNER